MCGFEEIVQKPVFWLKMAKNGHFWIKSQKRDFFSKIRLEHFFRLFKMYLCAKNHQNLMRGFLNMECDGRTNERTSVNP